MTDDLTKAELHEMTLPGGDWFTPGQLAARWKVCGGTVRLIPFEQLRYKEFGRGSKNKRRRYRADWVAAYEELSGRHAIAGAA